ncbi:hypothetical protein N7452_003994 [Penicillium brevicompactum]|uniref:Uncharacterized protein n=1 Tax=Penicillium brevicompactum TaxID=5074 RepID=A0A9W9QUN3_PENBR|nr:hypothetical protein N7452_003994 [Penicillium brevicompactum]
MARNFPEDTKRAIRSRVSPQSADHELNELRGRHLRPPSTHTLQYWSPSEIENGHTTQSTQPASKQTSAPPLLACMPRTIFMVR